MSRTALFVGLFVCVGVAGDLIVAEAQNQPAMSFFITSCGLGNGGNLRGLAGADTQLPDTGRGWWRRQPDLARLSERDG